MALCKMYCCSGTQIELMCIYICGAIHMWEHRVVWLLYNCGNIELRDYNSAVGTYGNSYEAINIERSDYNSTVGT